MSRQLAELETVLQQLIDEHRRMLGHVEMHLRAMKTFDLQGMDQAAGLQEASRLRIVTLETRRRMLVGQLAQVMKMPGEVTLKRIAELNPERGKALLRLRDELKAIVAQVAVRTQVSGKLSGAVLGHLNTVVRLLAGAVEHAGLYTKYGVPKVSARIGVMEAVG